MDQRIFSSSAFIFFFALAFFFANGELIRYSGNNLLSAKIDSSANDPEIIGPDKLCIVFGSVIGDFFGAGDAETDVYSWKILSPSNELLYEGEGGAGFQTISYTFSIIGVHRIELEVRRAGVLIKKDEKTVELIQGPKPLLKPSYSLCNGLEIELFAIDPTSPDFSDYVFNWTNSLGTTISTDNNLKTSTIGEYFVSFYFLNQNGIPECETHLKTKLIETSTFDIISSVNSTCPNELLTFSSYPMVVGEWTYEKSGGPRTLIDSGSSLTISSDELDGPGDYKIFLTLSNANNPQCIQEKSVDLAFTPRPNFEFISAKPSSGCLNPDGAIQIRALTQIDQLLVDGTSVSRTGLSPGDLVDLSGLKSGTYTVFGTLGSCINSLATVIPLENSPFQLEFDIIDIQPEICTATGKQDGSFKVKIVNGSLTGSYKVINERGGVIRSGPVVNQSEVVIEIPGGLYYFELFDKDICSLPQNDKIEVPALEQVTFSVPAMLSVCQSYELIPQSSQPLEFTIIFPDKTEQTKSANEAFILTEAGTYEVTGVLPNQTDICPTLKLITVELVEPVTFEPRLIKEDCFGNRTYQAEIFGRDPASVEFTWYNDADQIVGNGEFLFPTSFGEFKLDVQPAGSEACPIPPKVIQIEEPVLSVDLTLEYTKLCELGPRSILTLTVDRPDAITNIIWRRFDHEGNIDHLTQYNNTYQITVTEPGIYEASAFSIIPAIGKNCELGRNSIPIDLIPNKVTFDLPGDLSSICDPYELVPQGASNLEYLLTYPDGTVILNQSNQPFILDQDGGYTILGYNPIAASPLCPEQKTFNVTINPPVQFTKQLINITCAGEYEYRADISNYNLSEVDIFWKNPAGTVVSTDPLLFTSTYGLFSLEIQPKGSIPCLIPPISFDIPIPVLSQMTNLIAETLCPDQPDAALSVVTNFQEVQTIEWWFTDLNNNTSQLISDLNKRDILASMEGTYEVRLINPYGCQIGYDKALVIRSMDTVRPIVEASYLICPRYNIAETIDPGQFVSYEWYHEGFLVSTNPTFKPAMIGNFELIAYSAQGCAYNASFTTQEECDLKVRFPSAITPGDPEKPFLVYTNYLVDELEVWIFNHWGELIFNCSNNNLISEKSTCPWDGRYGGDFVINGTYAVVVKFTNKQQNKTEKLTKAITVIK